MAERTIARAVISLVLFAMPAGTSACTLCYGEAAALIRARLLAVDLWWNTGAVLLPLLALAALVASFVREPREARR